MTIDDHFASSPGQIDEEKYCGCLLQETNEKYHAFTQLQQAICTAILPKKENQKPYKVMQSRQFKEIPTLQQCLVGNIVLKIPVII